MKIFISLLLIFAFILSFSGCSNNSNSENGQASVYASSSNDAVSGGSDGDAVSGDSDGDAVSGDSDGDAVSSTELTYTQINAEEAKHIMDTECNYFIIDARTDDEFAEGHIEGAILIPEYEILTKAEEKIPDKNALILVYCRSGRRSKIASDALVQLGYTNVYEFGGIIDWPYEIVR